MRSSTPSLSHHLNRWDGLSCNCSIVIHHREKCNWDGSAAAAAAHVNSYKTVTQELSVFLLFFHAFYVTVLGVAATGWYKHLSIIFSYQFWLFCLLAVLFSLSRWKKFGVDVLQLVLCSWSIVVETLLIIVAIDILHNSNLLLHNLSRSPMVTAGVRWMGIAAPKVREMVFFCHSFLI